MNSLYIPDDMSDQPVIKKTVTIDPIEHRALQFLAELEHRTMSGQVTFMVERELRARGYDPDTLEQTAQPVEAVEP